MAAPEGNPRRSGSRGFTLVELLVALSVMAVLAVVAIPSFSRMLAGTAVSGHSNSFLADSRFARAEALKRGISVTMCRSADPEAAVPLCSKSSAAPGWETGWIVFADANGDNERTADEPLLRVQPAMPDSGGIYRSGGTAYNQLRYRANGWAAGATATLRFMPKAVADRADVALGRTVCVSILGRTRVLPTGDAACS